MKSIRLFFISLFLSAASSVLAGVEAVPQPSPTPADENHRDLFYYELDYTGSSNFYDVHGDFGHGDSLYNDFSYAHRFLITGKWYFRAGVEYQRFDFGGTDNGLPDHLQTVHAVLALEYVVHDQAGDASTKRVGDPQICAQLTKAPYATTFAETWISNSCQTPK